MSSEWVKAGKEWRGYCAPVIESGSGNSRKRKLERQSTSEATSEPLDLLPRASVSDFITRATMRELCLIAHNSGVVQVSHAELARRLGVSYSQIKRAISRLQSDGYLYLLKRGSGVPRVQFSALVASTAKKASPNVYLLARLSDSYGYQFPSKKFLEEAFISYSRTSRYALMSQDQRAELAELFVNWHSLGEDF